MIDLSQFDGSQGGNRFGQHYADALALRFIHAVSTGIHAARSRPVRY